MKQYHYWFRARRHGIGWVPNTWQGWTVLAVYVLLVVYSFSQIDKQSHSVSDTLFNFIPRLFLLTGFLTVITYLKGEPTSWRKGQKRVDEPPHKK
jgi:hypothetical protein